MKAQRQPVAQPWARYAVSPRLTLTFGWGLNENVSPAIDEALAGYNFDLAINQSSMVPRKPFDLAGTAPAVSGVINNVTSFMQLIKKDNSETSLVCSGNKVYKWDGASTYTSEATVTAPALLRDTTWALGDYIVITDIDKNNVVATWDGTTYATMTHTGVTGNLFAKYAIVQNNRVWLFNITVGTTAYPHMILACKFEDPTNWDNSTRGGPTTVGGGSFSTGLEAFYLLTPDLKAINGVTQIQNTLIISTEKGRIWQLSGSSSSTYQFTDFFDQEPSSGDQSMSSIGNDVCYVGRGGSIFLLSSTQNFGSVRAFSLSRWLPSSTANLDVNLTQIIYDVVRQRVLFFTAGKVLVFFKDMLAQDRFDILAGKSPWSVYTTSDSSSFNTSAARYMWAPGTTNYNVFWGDNTGRCFRLDGTGGSGDAGAATIQANRTSRHLGNEVMPPGASWNWVDENITGRIVYHRMVSVNATVSLIWDDEYSTTSNVVSLKGPAAGDTAPYFGGSVYFGGAFYFNAGFMFANRVSEMALDPGGKGPGFYTQVSATSASPFQIDAIEWD